MIPTLPWARLFAYTVLLSPSPSRVGLIWRVIRRQARALTKVAHAGPNPRNLISGFFPFSEIGSGATPYTPPGGGGLVESESLKCPILNRQNGGKGTLHTRFPDLRPYPGDFGTRSQALGGLGQ